ALLRFWDMACSFVFAAPCQIRRWRGRSTAGTIPLAELVLPLSFKPQPALPTPTLTEVEYTPARCRLHENAMLSGRTHFCRAGPEAVGICVIGVLTRIGPLANQFPLPQHL